MRRRWREEQKERGGGGMGGAGCQVEELPNTSFPSPDTRKDRKDDIPVSPENTGNGNVFPPEDTLCSSFDLKLLL